MRRVLSRLSSVVCGREWDRLRDRDSFGIRDSDSRFFILAFTQPKDETRLPQRKVGTTYSKE